MNFTKDDILDKSNSIWISEKLIKEVCNVSDDTLRTTMRKRYKSSVQPCHRHHNILPDTGKGWRFAKIKNKFYYALDNIPNRKPTYYRDLFGDREELVNAYKEAMENKTVSLLEPHFLHFKREIKKVYYQAYLNCSEIQQENLCIAAALLEGAIVWIKENEINTSKSAFFKEYCNLLDKYDIRYLPKNYRKLKEKIQKVTSRSLKRFQHSDLQLII